MPGPTTTTANPHAVSPSNDAASVNVSGDNDIVDLRAASQRASASRPTPIQPVARLSEATFLAPEEAEFLALVGPPAIADPRAVKRLVNSYQLVRAAHLAEFTGADNVHRPVQVLFGAMIGFPSVAVELFRLLAKSPDDDSRSWNDFVTDLETIVSQPQPLPDDPAAQTRAAAQRQELQRLARWLRDVTLAAEYIDQPVPQVTAQWKPWLEPVGRYSFIVGRWIARRHTTTSQSEAAKQAAPDHTESLTT